MAGEASTPFALVAAPAAFVGVAALVCAPAVFASAGSKAPPLVFAAGLFSLAPGSFPALSLFCVRGLPPPRPLLCRVRAVAASALPAAFSGAPFFSGGIASPAFSGGRLVF